jgi:hypothetical protein
MSHSVPKPSQNRTALSVKQEQAALALASGATKAGAANTVGRAVRTIKEWMMLDHFRSRVHSLRLEMTERALSTLAAAAAGFAQTLVAASKKAPKHRDRAAAARSGLDMMTRLNEKIALEQRVAELEARQPAQPLKVKRG